MKRNATIAILISTMLLAACHKREKVEEAPAAAATPAAAPAAPAPAPVAATPPAEQTAEQRDLARKQGLLDYGIMEDKYINDPRAQWAADAKASSVFGDENGKTPSEVNLAKNVVGPSDSREWTNNNIDKGFDWIETTYAKPVNATEVRVIINGGAGVQAINKVELQDVDGKWNTVWTGISDVKADARGNRTWFVRTFEKTAYKAKAVKVTYANNLDHDYKKIDAIQLVGD
ncbi:hypothetical protein [Duganella aceris]|uniref:Discoidin domain-containing protein n=1 Tax=Duganella aceris TaxID=2703883 RepID=A0ABX0FK85_9BURK|nr:hypothetical protein [Duganella aceris]NGZ84931.1 hypothetical protein [Duganella aceris]